MKRTGLSEYVSGILRAVEREGDRALIRFGSRFDGVKLQASGLRVSDADINGSVKAVSKPVRSALDKAAANVKRFHELELKGIRRSWKTVRAGVTVGQVLNPIESAGIYVPGGRFAYPSTVLMTAIPARTAGVKRVVMMTPPKNVTPELLYAAKISGVTEIYRVGGPWAVAALAFGTESVKRTDLVVGPGNKYVNEAKRQVFGRVGIDSLAGPSEIAVIADDSADERFVAQDILAQLEHDPDARAYLYTDSLKFLRGVNNALFGKADRKQFKAVKCSLERAIELVNVLAPEHLEIAVRNPKKTASKIVNAGAVFIGNYSPVAAGDYWAGPSHALPTGRSARYSGGVSAATFLKRTSFIELTRGALLKSAGWIKGLAVAEGLNEHNRSIEIREKQ